MPVVSLTFDDALPEHLDLAAPLLTERGFHGTFYVHLAARTLAQRAGEWASLVAHGHELGNHTIFHPASGSKDWVTSANAIEQYSLERMREELILANSWLTHLDNCAHRSFASARTVLPQS